MISIFVKPVVFGLTVIEIWRI